MEAAMVTAPERVVIQIAIGKRTAAESDPTETRRATTSITVKTMNANKTAGGDITAKHPAAVATPLPPSRNFRYKG